MFGIALHLCTISVICLLTLCPTQADEKAPIVEPNVVPNGDTKGSYAESVVQRGAGYLVDAEGQPGGFDSLDPGTGAHSRRPVNIHAHHQYNPYQPQQQVRQVSPSQVQPQLLSVNPLGYYYNNVQYPQRALQLMAPQYQGVQHQALMGSKSARPTILPQVSNHQYVNVPQGSAQILPQGFVFNPSTGSSIQHLPQYGGYQAAAAPVLAQGYMVSPGMVSFNPSKVPYQGMRQIQPIGQYYTSYVQPSPLVASGHQMLTNANPYMINPQTYPYVLQNYVQPQTAAMNQYGGVSNHPKSQSTYPQHGRGQGGGGEDYDDVKARTELARLLNPNNLGYNIDIKK